MDFILAKNKILALLREGNHLAYEKVNQEEYKQLYYAVFSHPYSGNKEWNDALGRFLFSGAFSYDRFVGLRPRVADEEQYNMFNRFLASLQKMDGNQLGRTAFFHLEKIQWDIYRECSLAPCDEGMREFLAKCEERIKGITLSDGDAKVIGRIEKKKEEISTLIGNIRDGLIRTKIHTTLPYKLADTNDTIHLDIDGVEVDIHLSNHSQGSTLPMTQIADGATLTTTGPSKWTTTTCELEIEAHCLIDGLEERPRVTLRNVDEDKGYWTAVFDFTYKVVSAIWLYMQQRENVDGTWPPLPNDIHYIDYQVYASDNVYDNEITTNPALVYHVKPLGREPKHHNIKEESGRQWSTYTFFFARQYAESGQFKEAIFWLNVSMEALVEEFIHRVSTTKDKLEEIEGEEHKFDTAEEILTEQFPEMKGRVKWPETVIHTSVFTKLKRAIKLSGLPLDQKEIVKKYSLVNAKRNDLFHGESTEIGIGDVEKAFGAYKWLRGRLGGEE